MKLMLLISLIFIQNLISIEKTEESKEFLENSIESMPLPKSIFTVIPKDENSRMWYLMLTRSGMIRQDAFKIMEEQELNLDLNPTREKAVKIKESFDRRLSEDELKEIDDIVKKDLEIDKEKIEESELKELFKNLRNT